MGGPEIREYFSEERASQVVGASFADTPDPRLRQLLTSLVQAPARLRQGRRPDGTRMGVSPSTSSPAPDRPAATCDRSSSCSRTCWVSRCSSRRSTTAPAGTSTESTVLGPFHMVESPVRELGRQHQPRRQGHPLPGVRQGHRPGRRTARRSERRRVAGQRGRLLRRPAAGPPTAGQPPGTVHHRRATAGSGSGPSSRATTRSPTTGRSASCWPQPAGTRTGRRICTSSPPHPATSR